MSLSAALIGGLSCGREVTGPGDGQLLARGFAFALEFGPLGAANGVASQLVPFERVRVTLDNVANVRAVDRTIDFPSNSEQVEVSLSVPLSEGTGSDGEPMTLNLAFINAAGDTVFRAVPQSVLVKPSIAGQPPTIVPTVQVVPTGPAANAASVAISPESQSVLSGEPFAFTAQALDGQGAPIAGVPIGWVSLDPQLASIPLLTSGAGTTLPGRGVARIAAVLPGGQADTVTVNVAPRAASIEVASGSAQSATAGATLSAPIVARVRASDGLPMSGVTVVFAAGTGGSVSADTVVSDINGLAATSWTLGSGLGVQTATATAIGLTGSPLTFTATATSGGVVASQLTFDVQPAGSVLGASITPAIQVTARDGQGNIATSFTGAVTLALASNPTSTTLIGTLTVNAVAGVATFSSVIVGAVGSGYTLSATASGLTSATSAAFNIIAGPATNLAFTVQPNSLPAGGTISPAVVVAARDAFGATATSYTGTVTIALGTNPGGSTLSGTLTVNAVAGVATFAGLSLNNAGAGYTLTATATGLTSATSASFAVTTGVIGWTNPSGGSWSEPSNWSLGRVPVTTDSVVIELAGTYTVTLDTTFTGSFISLGGSSGAQTLSLSDRTLTISGVLATQGSGRIATTNATLAGAGALVNASTGSIALRNSSVALSVQNAGTIDARQTVTISGALSTTIGSVLSVTGEGFATNGVLVVNNGFTNNGSIRIDFFNTTGGQTSTFAVANGALVNAPTGVIEATATSPTAVRFLNAQLINQGSIQVNSLFTHNASAAGSSSGSIVANVDGAVTLAFAGLGASFSNSGTVTLPAGRSWTTANTGTFVMEAGSGFSGGGSYSSNSGATTVFLMAPSLSSVGANGGTLAIGSGIVIAGGAMPLTNAIVNGAGAIELPVASTSTWRNATVSVPLQLDGTLDTRETTTISGPITTSATSLLRVAGEGFAANGVLNVSSGLTNNGTIALDFVNVAGGQFTRLQVSGGPLVNAAGATIHVTGTTPTATRQLSAALDNQGSLLVDASATITATGPSSNSGAITVGAAGSVAWVFAGVTPSLVHSGSLTIPTGRSWITSGVGTATMAAASSVSGGGSYSSNTGATTIWEVTPALASVGSDGGTLSVASGITLSEMDIPLNAATLVGAGNIIVSAGRSALWRNVNTALPVQLVGTLEFRGTSSLAGALTSTSSGVLRVTGEGFASNGILTIVDGFTNLGVIELDFVNGAGGQFTRLQVSNGVLTNAPGGVIHTTANFPTAQRQLSAVLDNQGSLLVDAITALTAAGTNVSSGSIALGAAGGMTLAFSGLGASFTQSGALSIPTGRAWNTTGAGTFTFTAASSATGGGSYVSSFGSTTVLEMVPALASLGADNGTISIGSGVTLNALDFTLTQSIVNGAGSLILGTGRSALWRNATIAVPFLLEGTLDARGTTNINGGISTTTTALLRVTGEGFASNGILNVASGFTNNGIIELDFVNAAGGQTTTLQVNGTLVNAPGAQLRITGNTPTADRTVSATLDNQGAITVDGNTVLIIYGASQSTGSIVLGATGSVRMAFGFGPPTFVNSGVISIPTGRSWQTINTGTITMTAASTVNGGGSYTTDNGALTIFNTLPALASVGAAGGTLSLGNGVTLAEMTIPLLSAAVNGPGAIEVSSGRSMLWRSSTVSVPVTVHGTLEARGSTQIQNSVSTSSAAVIRVAGEGFASNGLLTFAGGFTNNGLIELDFLNAAGGQETRLVVNSGTLVNASAGIIRSTAGTPTAPRFLQANLNNQGTIELQSASTLLLFGVSANSGSIAVGSEGSFGLTLSGGSPSFNQNGSVTLPAGRTWSTAGTGNVNLNFGSVLNGGGVYSAGSGVTTNYQMNPSLAAVSASGGFVNVLSNVILDGFAINLSAGATLGGAGSIVLAPGTTSTWRAANVSLPVTIAGTLDTRGATSITGAIITAPSSVLRVTGEGFGADGILTVANGFTNNGLLELDYANINGGQVTRLIVSSGTLLNASSGTLRTTANTPQAGRFLQATLDNQGLLELFPGAAGTLTQTGSLVSSGSIVSSVGGLTGGTQYGRMDVNGTAIVGGTLTVGLFGGFTPASANFFDIITSAGAMSGSFANATLGGLPVTPTTDLNRVRITVP